MTTIERWVAMLGAALVAGCASGPSPVVDRTRARERVLAAKSCPDKQIVHEDPSELKFVLMGCNVAGRVKVNCDASECLAILESSTVLAQPRRLQSTDGKLWLDPAPPPGNLPRDPNAAVTVKTGKRLSDINDPANKPALPKELNVPGLLVWGLYKVCVTNTGDVRSVEVIKSAIPGGLDGFWISKIENWKYEPYAVSGRPVPFCHPARIDVRSSS
jgi:hypothetical protein